MTSRRIPSPRDWLTVFACLVCQIGMGVGGYVFPVFLKPVTEDLGWTRAQYSFANPIMSTMVAAAGPLVGWFADRRGPRPILVAGALMMSGALYAAGAMQSPADFYVVAVFIGIAVACLGDLPTGAAVAHRFRDRRGLALGMVYVGSSIGGALIPLVATALAVETSWRGAFASIGSWLWVPLLPLALIVGRPSKSVDSDPALDANGAADDSPAAALRQRDFWLLFWVLFAFYFYRLGVNVHLVAYLTDLGYSSLEAAGGFSLTLSLGIAGKLVAGAIADRVGARVAVIGNFTLIAIASMLLLLSNFPGAIPTFLVVHGFSTAAEDVVIPLIIGQRFGMRNLGRVYGLLLIALVPGGAVGPVLAGRIFDATGSYASVFTLYVLGNVLAVAALALVRSERRVD